MPHNSGSIPEAFRWIDTDPELRAEAEKIASAFHAEYESLAPSYGYRTREASAVTWEDVPQANRLLMIHVAANLLINGVVE